MWTHTIVSDGVSATQTSVTKGMKQEGRPIRFESNEAGDIEFIDELTEELLSTHTTNKPTLSGGEGIFGVRADCPTIGSTYRHEFFIYGAELGVVTNE